LGPNKHNSICQLRIFQSHNFSTSNAAMEVLKIAIIGQSQFAAEVYNKVKKNGHEVVGIFTIPDKNGREDPVATTAAKDGVKVFKFKSWRKKVAPGKFEVLPAVLDQYKSVNANVNVMPFCSQFIPMEVINHPKHKSICYHPSLLPRHRGASAINWTLMEGDRKGGFSIFWADDGLDTGPILLQRECYIGENDTVDSVYNGFMYPVGIEAMSEAVDMIAEERAPVTKQTEIGATYDPMCNKPEVTKLNLQQPARKIHDFIRGLDSVPGAWTLLDGKETKLFGSKLWHGVLPTGTNVNLEGAAKPGIVHENGLLVFGSDGKALNVKLLSVEGKFVQANEYGKASSEDEVQIELTEEEKAMVLQMRQVWNEILKIEIADDTDFFATGAGSMDVVRLVEEVKDKTGVEITNEDVFMATAFADFIKTLVKFSRGGGGAKPLNFEPVRMHINKMDISFATQLFIDGEFCNATSGKKSKSYNPHDESVICEVEAASVQDVDRAVKAAHKAFHEGDWGKMSARERGSLLFRLADLMDQHKEELATIESIDSGAVYTLAIKTHVGMSIDTWRYMAGWCDKIQGETIPINHARPSRNFAVTRKEPIGVCGLVTPWNYPLMMLSWKMAACLAAGNTVVIKPAQVCPLTALKFAELSHMAGIPPGVINVVTGSGSVCGQAIADHPLVRKLGFTGSTPVGKTIMKSCATSNLKKASLELGGKSPLIIFGDFDLDRAVKIAMGSVFFNKGENCIAAGRIFVEETIYDEFLQKVVDETKKMKIGDPLDRSTAHGPQNHRAHLQKLVEYCQTGVEQGARLLLGGKQCEGSGLYMEPTIFADVEDTMWIAEEESFGPIMIVSRFAKDDVEGVVARANDTEFGLASGVLSDDINKAMKVAEKIEAGTCFVNTYNKTDVAAPFGGFKQSGFGKDLGQAALNEYLKTKSVIFEYS